MTIVGNICLALIYVVPDMAGYYFKPTDGPIPDTPLIFTILERLFEVGMLVTLIFNWKLFGTRTLPNPAMVVLSVVIVASMALYLAIWGVYFTTGRSRRILYGDWPFPLPLAITPVVLFIAAGLNAWNLLLVGFTALFGLFHILKSVDIYRNIHAEPPLPLAEGADLEYNDEKSLDEHGHKPAYPKEEIIMKKYECDICGYVYDPAVGDPDNGVAPGTAWEDVPADWTCPDCGVGKDDFSPVA